MSFLDALFQVGSESDTDALRNQMMIDRAGLGTTVKYFQEKIDALEKRVSELERKTHA